MKDQTETIRRERLVEINAEPGSREALEGQYGQVWDTQELGKEFKSSASWHRSLWCAAKRTA